MGKIVPSLWFNGNLEEALEYYRSIFRDTEVMNIARYPEGAPMPAGTVLAANFRIEDQEFLAINAGPEFTFNEAVSFKIDCVDQEEVDYFWEKLTADGGQESQCGWLKDKFGLSWQVVPRALDGLIAGPDPAGAQRATQAMMQMRKLDVQVLQQAYDNA